MNILRKLVWILFVVLTFVTACTAVAPPPATSAAPPPAIPAWIWNARIATPPVPTGISGPPK